MKHLLLAALFAGALLAACSGGGGGSSPAAPIAAVSASPQATRTPGIAGPQNGTRGSVTLTIGATTHGTSSTRRASFVSPNSSSVSLTINNDTGMYDVSGTSSFCTPVSGGRTCTLPANVGAGTTAISVSVSVFAGAGGTGALLGGGSGSTTISPTATSFTVPPIDINPNVASVTATVTFGNGFPRFIYGTNESGTINLTFKDGSNAIIPNTNTSPFLTPIRLTTNDTHVTINASPVTNAAQAVQMTYDGTTPLAATSSTITITAMPIGGSSIGSAGVAISGFPTTFTLTGGVAKGLRGIAAGPDSNMWFVEEQGNAVGRVLLAPASPIAVGTMNEFPLPAGSKAPQEITAAPAGNTQMWFGETSVNEVASVDTGTGVINQHFMSGGSNPQALTVVGTGLWVTAQSSNSVYAFDSNGTPAPQPAGLPSSAPQPAGIAVGADSSVYVTAIGTGQIFVYNPATLVIIATYTAAAGAASQPMRIVSGPDGALWYTEYNAGAIGRLTTGGVGANFPIPGPSSGPYAITSGPDGGIWFTMSSSGAIGRIDPTTHAIIQYTHSGTAGYGIATGPDGNIWFTDSTNGAIVRLQP